MVTVRPTTLLPTVVNTSAPLLSVEGSLGPERPQLYTVHCSGTPLIDAGRPRRRRRSLRAHGGWPLCCSGSLTLVFCCSESLLLFCLLLTIRTSVQGFTITFYISKGTSRSRSLEDACPVIYCVCRQSGRRQSSHHTRWLLHLRVRPPLGRCPRIASVISQRV